MIIISKSPGICGACGSKLEVEWDLDLIDYYVKAEGIRNLYESDVDIVCPECGNFISAKLFAAEYPEGVLENSNVIIEKDETQKSQIEKPSIAFFDL